MSRVLTGLCTLACGCGRLDFEAFAGDGGTNGNATDGATADACALGPFGAPQELSELDTPGDDWGPWLTDDRLEIYFASNNSGAHSIYHATRSSPAATFGAPVLVNLGFDADDPFVSTDGLTLWLFAYMGSGDIYSATRSSTGAAFGAPQPANQLNSPQEDNSPSLTSDSLTVILASARGGTSSLFRSTRTTPTGAFGTPSLIAELDIVSEQEDTPTISGDGIRLVYTTSSATSTSRIVESVRVGATYQPAQMLTELHGGDGIETDPELTTDGQTIVFSSNRTGGPGGFDLYIAERSCQ